MVKNFEAHSISQVSNHCFMEVGVELEGILELGVDLLVLLVGCATSDVADLQLPFHIPMDRLFRTDGLIFLPRNIRLDQKKKFQIFAGVAQEVAKLKVCFL